MNEVLSINSAVFFNKSFIGWIKNRRYSLAKSGLLSVASQGITSATNFLTGIMVARLCSKEQFGLYALSLTVVSFFTDFQASLITTPYMIYSPRLDGVDKRRYLGSALMQQIAFSLLASLFLLVFSVVASCGFGPRGLTEILKVLAVFMAFIMLKDFARQICFATLKVKTAMILDICVALIQIGGLCLLWFNGSLSSKRSFIAIGTACLLVSIAWLILNRKLFLPELTKVLPDFLQNWNPAKWIIASHLLWTFATNLYPWLISAFHGVTANATWGACLGTAALGNVILLGIQNVLGPKIMYVFAKDGVSGMCKFIVRSASLFILVMSGICLFYVIFGNQLLVLFYGKSYGGNGLIVFILVLNLLIAPVSFSFSRGLFAMERADVECLVNVIGIAVLFIFGIWFVRKWGPLGAAGGLLVASVLSLMFRIAFFRRIAI